MTVNIVGIDKAALLRALYNRAQPQGLGWKKYDPRDMTLVEAQAAVEACRTARRPLNFDYLGGRVMKVDISGDEVQECWYDRDNGDGAFWEAVKPLYDAVRSRAHG